MTQQQQFRPNEAARIRSGKFAGMVGIVNETRSDGTRQISAQVLIEGVQDGQPVKACQWFKVAQLEHAHA